MAKEAFNSWKHYIKKPPSTEEDNKGKSIGHIPTSIHGFYKQVSSFYNVNLSDIINNILLDWKEKYEKQIQEDMISQLKERKS